MFKNRQEAGRLLAQRLQKYQQKKDVLVLALPRGGVPVAYQTARILKLPLDILIVRKLGSLFNPEYAIGALSETGVIVWNEREKNFIQDYPEEVEKIIQREQKKIKSYQKKFRKNKKRKLTAIQGREIILIDDGLATGLTMEAAVLSCQKLKAKKITAAVPAAALDSVQRLQSRDIEFVGLEITPFFSAVAQFYEEFDQVNDQEVEKFLLV